MIDNIIEKIQVETKYSLFKIITMYLHDKFKYNVSIDEFYELKFYKISEEIKKSFVTIKDNEKLIKKYNSKVDNYKIKNRNILYNIFNENVKREYLILDDQNILEFREFVKGKKQIVVRKIDGYEKEILSLSNYKVEKLYLTLFEKNIRLVEEYLHEDKTYNKFYLKNDFTINFIALNDKIILSTIKTKNIYYNIENGKFKNKKIPYLDEMKDLAINMVKSLDNLNYLYLEFFVSNKGIELISINDKVPIIQNDEALLDNRGYKEKIQEFLE